MTTSAGKGAGMPQQSFEPDQMIGWPAEQAAERLRAEGFGPVLLVEPEQVGAPGFSGAVSAPGPAGRS
jgi:hypothetical protein